MLTAVLCTVLAGAATLLGGALGLHPGLRRPGPLAMALAFAAGIMLVLSFVEILPFALSSLADHGVASPHVWVVVAFLLGGAGVVLLDRWVPVRPVREGPVRERARLSRSVRCSATSRCGPCCRRRSWSWPWRWWPG